MIDCDLPGIKTIAPPGLLFGDRLPIWNGDPIIDFLLTGHLARMINAAYNTAFVYTGGAMAIRLNITMDKDIYARLKQEVPPKKFSAFISSAVRAKLYPDTKTLDAAYRAARKERWRKELEDAWKNTEGEGWPT
ncbi:MAG: hypothetical protein IPK92_09405 [Nitrospira sp.]|nr:hypothetical protein [Nitrospira sp.]MBL8051855.1 hypothetical protein [Nitrospira sp.]